MKEVARTSRATCRQCHYIFARRGIGGGGGVSAGIVRDGKSGVNRRARYHLSKSSSFAAMLDLA